MDPKVLFEKALNQAGSCIEHVHDDQLSNKTPCTEWNLKALLSHMVYELSWVPDMLAGKTIAEVGSKYDGDLLGSSVQSAWRKAAQAAETAARNTSLHGTVHLSYADVPAEYYLNEISNDTAVHGWDVAQSIKCNLIFDAQLAKTLYNFMEPRRANKPSSSVFAAAIDVPENAPTQTKLLALLGRRAEHVNESD